MEEVIRINEENEKTVEFTHYLHGTKGWCKSSACPEDYNRVVYLGMCHSDGDMFACYLEKTIIIQKGHLNSGKYQRMEGKAKIDFEKWYKVAYIEDSSALWKPVHNKSFFHLPDNMQWGVIQDWFDSVGDYVCVEGDGDDFMFSVYHTESKNYLGVRYDIPSRQEARTAAIEKACEIYNERK